MPVVQKTRAGNRDTSGLYKSIRDKCGGGIHTRSLEENYNTKYTFEL